MLPVEPPPSRWRLPPGDIAGSDDLVATGGDLLPGTLLAAYRSGLFPMPVAGGLLGWWSPAQRGLLPLEGLHVSASLRRSVRRLRTTVDTAFDAVVDACAATPRPHGWISPDIVDAYRALYRLGWCHSVETWEEDRLVGGLYGVGIGGLFCGESMFHTARDASKVALVRLVEVLSGGDPAHAAGEGRLLDVQWVTPHLASLGAVTVPRREYARRLEAALRLTPPRWPG